MDETSTIRSAMRIANRTAIVTAAGAILLLALLVGFSLKPLYNHFAGPFDGSAEELIAYQGPASEIRTYVTLQPDIALDTGFYYFEKQEDGTEKVIHAYYALLFDEHLLLAKYQGTAKGDLLEPEPVTGTIVKLTEEEQTEVLQTLIDEYPNLKDAFLPYLLDTTASSRSVWLTIIGIAFLAALSIWSVIRIIRRSVNRSNHPIARELSRFGDWQQMAQEIDTQMAEPHETYGKSFHLTREWLIYQSRNSFEAVPYRDLIWHYMFQVTYQSFGVATGKAYSLMICDRHGKVKPLLDGKNSVVVSDLMEKLKSLAPWAYAGYSDELQNAWNQERENMIATVDARKQALEQGSVENQEVTGQTRTNF